MCGKIESTSTTKKWRYIPGINMALCSSIFVTLRSVCGHITKHSSALYIGMAKVLSIIDVKWKKYFHEMNGDAGMAGRK